MKPSSSILSWWWYITNTLWLFSGWCLDYLEQWAVSKWGLNKQGTKVLDIFTFVSNRKSKSQKVAVVVRSDSQFGDVAEESSGQSLQVFVAAPDHCVHTGTLAGTLRPGGTAAVLQNRALTHRKEGGGSAYFSYITHCYKTLTSRGDILHDVVKNHCKLSYGCYVQKSELHL